jgi:hypothetical protein
MAETNSKPMANKEPEGKKIFSDWEIVHDSTGIDAFLPPMRCKNCEI